MGMEKTLVVWRRTGKEHGEEGGFRNNDPETVSRSLEKKAARFRATDDEAWRWFRAEDETIMEKPAPSNAGFAEDSVIYYMPRKQWAVIRNARFPGLGDEWSWYVHMGDLYRDEDLDAYVFKDLFIDVVVKKDLKTYKVLDVEELTDCMKEGIIRPTEAVNAMHAAEELVKLIRAGKFPPPEVATCQQRAKELGWEA